MGDPVPSSAISDATTGGLSVIVITGGSTGQVLTQQADGTYAPATVSAGIGGSVGATDNRLVRSDGTGGSTVQSTGIAVDDSNNVTGVAAITASGSADVLQLMLSGEAVLTRPGSLYGSTLIHTAGNGNFALINGFGAVIRSADRYGWINSNNVASDGYSYDTALGRNAAGVVEINNGTAGTLRDLTLRNLTASGLISLGAYTVATLPSAAANAGRIAQATDSSVTTNGSAVAGGGANRVMVFSNGSNWGVVVA